jgi:hypothetical protein
MISDFIDDSLDGADELRRVHNQFLGELKGFNRTSCNQWRWWATNAIAKYAGHPWIASVAFHLAADEQETLIMEDSCDLMSLGLALECNEEAGVSAAEILAAQRSLSSIFVSLAQTRLQSGDIGESVYYLKLATHYESLIPRGKYRTDLRAAIVDLVARAHDAAEEQNTNTAQTVSRKNASQSQVIEFCKEE